MNLHSGKLTYEAHKIDEEDNIPIGNVSKVEKELRNMYSKKIPGFNLLTGDTLKHFPTKAVKKITNIINAAFQLSFVHVARKFTEIVLIFKQKASYRLISLLTIISDYLKKYSFYELILYGSSTSVWFQVETLHHQTSAQDHGQV